MVTIKDVARMAGVSVTAVSAVLGKRSTPILISDITRKKILEAAEHLGYCRNAIAGQMLNGKSRMVVYLGSLFAEYNFRIFSAALDSVQAQNYTLKVSSVSGGEDNDSGRELVDRLKEALELRPEGVLIAGTYSKEVSDQAVRMVGQSGIPLVFLGNLEPNRSDVNILFDDIAGMELAVEHLHSRGHRNIAFASLSPRNLYIQDRLNGFRMASEKYGLEVHEPWLFQENYLHTDRLKKYLAALFERKSRPTAFCCTSDYIGLDIIMTLLQMGKNVPGDVSVIGYGNLAFSYCSELQMTTVSQCFEEMGRQAVTELFAMIREKGRVKKTVRISPDLMVRKTTEERIV